MPNCYARLPVLRLFEALRLGIMTPEHLSALRTAYACATVGSVRLTAHAVNVHALDPQIGDAFFEQSEDLSISAMEIARVLVAEDSFAPASFRELELLSGIHDAVAGSDLAVVVKDANFVMERVGQAFVDAGLAEVAA